MSTTTQRLRADVLARRDIKHTIEAARDAGLSHYGIAEAMVCGHRGLDLAGPDERRLVAILAGIWADADDQRVPQ